MEERKLNSVKRIICSGEALPCTLGDRIHIHFNADLHNLYGPTEAAIDVTAHTHYTSRYPTTSIPIGKPIHNTQLYILDSHLHPTPLGVPGELYIAGDGLARGYLNNPALTAERFIPNPFFQKAEGNVGWVDDRKPNSQQVTNSKDALRLSPNTSYAHSPTPPLPHSLTLYKTGDRVRYLPDGTIEFLDRIDTQVKLRGLRVELGEIESALKEYPKVHQAIVTVTERNEQKYLIAYVTVQSSTIDVSVLKEFLGDRLPPYMIPTAFIALDTIPLTVSGKLDRRSLPSWQPKGSAEMVTPRTATEQVIKEIWSSVLKVDRFSVEDNFFDLGGNSLLATRINSRLREVFDLEVPLRSLFEKQTVAALSQYVDATQMALQRSPRNSLQNSQRESAPVSTLTKGGLRGVSPENGGKTPPQPSPYQGEGAKPGSQPNPSTSKGRKEIEL